MKCDQCEMVSINGIATHEHGCPNRNLTWSDDYGRFVRLVECRECGCEIEVGEICDCAETIHDVDVEDLENGEVEPERMCIVDGQFGIYVPTRFAAKFRNSGAYCVLHVTPGDWDELEKGPDVEGYWELWDEIMRDAVIIDNETGTHYHLEQDGDLFMVAK